MAHNELSHLDLHCLTFSLSTTLINFFPSGSLLKKKKKKADDKCAPKFGTERIKTHYIYGVNSAEKDIFLLLFLQKMGIDIKCRFSH